MAEVVVVGGGVVGLGLAMMLARDGHDVTVLERDASPPPDGVEAAWDNWERRGVAQFRLAHAFLARYRQIVESELPELASALVTDGALRQNPLVDAPESIRGPLRPGDERFEILTGRRVMVERVVASCAAATPGLTVRRGTAVNGLVTGPEAVPGIPNVVGVRTEAGEELGADLVIDMSGRRSALTSWLGQIGCRSPIEEVDDSGFMYYGRHYRSPDGSLPPALGGALQEFGSISALTLGADNGHWATALIARSDDRAMRRLTDTTAWEKVFRSLPTVAHWADGQPVEDRIVTMAKIEDRARTFEVDGRPIVTGLLAVADAWACTNPSLGRGASIGMMHARLLRDCLRAPDADDPSRLTAAFNAATAETVRPWYDATVEFDRRRLEEMGSLIEGGAQPALPPDQEMTKALQSALLKDADCFRGFLDIVMVQALPDEVMSRPGLFEKVIALGSDWRQDPVIGPDRAALVALVNS